MEERRPCSYPGGCGLCQTQFVCLLCTSNCSLVSSFLPLLSLFLPLSYSLISLCFPSSLSSLPLFPSPSLFSSSSFPLFPLSRYYQRQSTADSAFSTDSTGDSYGPSGVFKCKQNIEEEEAEAEAKVRSMLPEDPPHPSLFGLEPPTAEVLIHVQPGGRMEVR